MGNKRLLKAVQRAQENIQPWKNTSKQYIVLNNGDEVGGGVGKGCIFLVYNLVFQLSIYIKNVSFT